MKQRAFLAIGTIVLCAGLLAGCGKVTKSVEINYGETYKIEDEKLEGKENLTWESADAEIVEVADDGTVTAKAPGKAKVAIKENGKSVGEYYEHSETHLSVSNRGSSSTSGKTSTSNNKDSYGHTKGDAFAIAEKAVKGKLKSPSTAKFCSVTEATIGCSGNTWVVRGWVDAQNGFGATVRTQFAVTFTFASKDMYSLDSCIVT